MSTTQILYCPNCKQNVVATREEINLFLALILVILTSGIGLLIYLIIYYEREPKYCVHCHTECEMKQLKYEEEESIIVPMQKKAHDARYCFCCGTTLKREETKYCPLCGTLIE